MRNTKNIFIALFAVILLAVFMIDVSNAQSISISGLKMNHKGSSTVKDTIGYKASDTSYTVTSSMTNLDSLNFTIAYSDSVKVAIHILTAPAEGEPFYRASTVLDSLTATAAGYTTYSYSAILAKVGKQFGAIKFEYVFQATGNAVDAGRYIKSFTKKYSRK